MQEEAVDEAAGGLNSIDITYVPCKLQQKRFQVPLRLLKLSNNTHVFLIVFTIISNAPSLYEYIQLTPYLATSKVTSALRCIKNATRV